MDLKIIFIFGSFFLGYILNKYYSKTTHLRNYFSKYLLYIGLPLYIISSFSNSSEFSISNIFLTSFVSILAMIFIGYYISKLIPIGNKGKASLFLCSAFGNSAFIGIPLLYELFGTQGTIIATIFSITLIPLRYTLGLYLAQKLANKNSGIKNIFKLPFFWVLILSMIGSLFIKNIPKSLPVIASFGTYIVLFIIGSQIKISFWSSKLANLSLIKILIMPIISLPIFILFNVNIFPFILLAGAPAAFTNSALTLEMGFNSEFASQLIIMSTIIYGFVLLILSLFI